MGCEIYAVGMATMQKKRMTLRHLALKLDTSIASVSRALSGSAAMDPESAAKIRKLAAELNYVPKHARPRGMAPSPLAARRIGLISLGLDRSLLTVPTLTSVINGAEATLTHAGAKLLLAHVPDLNAVPSVLEQSALDGALLLGALQGKMVAEHGGTLLGRLREVPTVWMLGRPEGCWGDAVGAADEMVGQRAADHLFERGHRNVAFLNPKPDHLLFNRRKEGFEFRCTQLGMTVRRFEAMPTTGWAMPLHPPQNVAQVQELVDAMLSATPRPSAVFAAADSVAMVVYGALAVRGVRVGRDMSVISGNNDQALITGLYPALTTLDIHAEQIGREAAQRLGQILSRGLGSIAAELLLEPTLITGESVCTLAGVAKRK
jgi:LacI family transcriptional regulator